MKRLIKAVRKLAADCEIPATIQELDVPQNVFTENLQSLVMMALGNIAAMGNPRVAMAAEVGALFMTAYSGQAPQAPAAESGGETESEAAATPEEKVTEK